VERNWLFHVQIFLVCKMRKKPLERRDLHLARLFVFKIPHQRYSKSINVIAVRMARNDVVAPSTSFVYLAFVINNVPVPSAPTKIAPQDELVRQLEVPIFAVAMRHVHVAAGADLPIS
jgi:hypothetical protein